MQDLPMSRKEENSNMETRTTSELCSNSLPNRLPANGKVECWPADMRKIPPAKAGNMAIPFQSELKIRPTPARCDASRRVFFFCCLSSFSSFRPRCRSTSLTTSSNFQKKNAKNCPIVRQSPINVV